MLVHHRRTIRALAWALTYCIAFGPFPDSAVAAPTDILDRPLGAKKPSPNLIVALDDSASMDNEVSVPGNDGTMWWNTEDGRFHGRTRSDIADFVVRPPWGGTGSFNFNETGEISDKWKKYNWLFSDEPCAGAPGCDKRASGDESHGFFVVAPTAQFAFTRSAAYNKQYYNPALTYEPWKPYNDGTTSCPSGTPSGTGSGYLCIPGNANPIRARSHPVLGGNDPSLTNLTADTSIDYAPGRSFRMYAGMIIPANAKFRICNSENNRHCGPYLPLGQTSVTSQSHCLINNRITSCVAMGMPITGATIDLHNNDHADVRISYFPSHYYKVDNSVSAPAAYGPDGAKLVKIEIKPGTTLPPKAATRTDCSGATCTDKEEMQNFANWFQYYRKRHLNLNAAMGSAFEGVRNLRGGAFRFNSDHNTTGNVTMYDFDSSEALNNERRFMSFMYQTKGDGETPTRSAMDWLGRQFMRSDVGDAGKPIIAACQYNAGFVITDGFANKGGPSYGNYDGTAAAPYKDKWSNTMADMALTYYTINLRPDLPTGKVPVDEEDKAPDADKNPNLHMNTFGLILGLRGDIFGNTTDHPNENTDPYAFAPNWDTADPTQTTRSPKAIDELWHATINGRGKMLRADSADQTRNAILEVIANVAAKDAAAAAVSFSNPNLVADDNFAYASSYNAGSWSGDLSAYTLSVTTGEPVAIPVWTAQKILAARTDPRIIATYNGAAGTAFQWSSVTTDQKSALASDPKQLNYLRGDRSEEGTQATKFRSRGARPPFTGAVPDNISVLGDIVNSEAVFLGAPKFKYLDPGYLAYRGTHANRRKMVYQGANDGMMHAFDAVTGAEAWAYVPSLLFSNLSNLTSKENFVHKFYVDGTPAIGDVYFESAWQTILVGGFGKGGRGYYALDVTLPTSANEDELAKKVLWEFPNAATAAHKVDVGYSFGTPVIVKTRASGWVVLVTSGYNNGSDTTGGDGQGHLFVLNAKTGRVIKDLETSGGTPANPSGLAHISAFVDHGDKDNTVEAVYGGDLNGNVWRFDLSGPTDASWNVVKLAALVDLAGNPQPVTTEPELAVVGRNRMVYVGTGQYLGNTDIPGQPGVKPSATSPQTMYGLKDDLSPAPLVLRANLQKQEMKHTSGAATISTNLFDLNVAANKGWFVDLPERGERVVTHPVVGAGVLIFVTNIPDASDPCAAGGTSWIYGLDYATGGNINRLDPLSPIGTFLGEGLVSGVSLVKLPDGSNGSDDGYRAIVNREGTPEASTVKTGSSGGAGRRKSWREIIVQ